MYQHAQASIAVFLLSSLKMLLVSAIEGAAEPTEKWIHTTYSNRVTTIAVVEMTGKGQFYSVYETMENGKPIRGQLNITSIRRDKTYTYLSGMFSDTCTGRISIRRPNPQAGLPMVAQVNWIVTRESVNFIHPHNQDCKVLKGQKFQLNLLEALPKANNRGDFTNANSNTFLGESGIYTWTQWQVVSADGMLNCRDQPNGVVKYSYRKGQIISKLGREMLDGRNLVELPDGSSWLRTKEKCCVRASDRLIKTVSLPTQNW
ncbi:hypothetical protein JOY44_27775 (plasmid) [Phormidium sp. CLA17]|uniref:hypothetical protein n=1 Tax=Leptolyngbya sp. Cla-17 TaxID=2803751 RepID=UPI0014914807|nr:hypothetical protein [Leptolyngbya sp. Cla-17]MBM0745274.1 hypothetical protein [Leptolyngbya sp. Cla-17]